MIRKGFLIYGLVVLALVSVAELQGWSLDRVDQVPNVPKTVRDNPGSYRSIYGFYHHYTGGK
jgi:hypothetical protein